MSAHVRVGVLAAAVAASAGSASAEISANIAVTSNYVWRGMTQSDSGPAVQGGVDLYSDVFYAGAWASSIDFNAPGTTELDLYVGYAPSLGDVAFDFSVLGYFYPQANDDGAESDFQEFLAAAKYTITEPLVVGVAINYSPEFFGETGEATYVEVNGAYAFTEAVAVSAAYGSQDVKTLGDYATWNIGGTVSAYGLEFDLRYHDLDIAGADSEIAFTIRKSL